MKFDYYCIFYFNKRNRKAVNAEVILAIFNHIDNDSRKYGSIKVNPHHRTQIVTKIRLSSIAPKKISFMTFRYMSTCNETSFLQANLIFATI